MASTVRMKRSAVPAKVPLVADLNLGEIAINTYDGKVYIKRDDGTEAIVTVGAPGASPVRTANFTFTAFGPREICNTTAGAITGTLPPSPIVGVRVEFADGADFSANALTIGRNSQLVEALAEDVTINTKGLAGGFVFIGGATGWKAYR